MYGKFKMLLKAPFLSLFALFLNEMAYLHVLIVYFNVACPAAVTILLTELRVYFNIHKAISHEFTTKYI